jgi:carbamoyl-phosphate synthase large subunit
VTKLLFTGGGGAGNEAIYRLLADRYDCHFADADLASIDDGIPAANRHSIPAAQDSDFETVVASLCSALGVDLLIPGVDEELPKLPLIMRAMPALKILAPDSAFISRMSDKLSMIHALNAAGLPAPWTSKATERDCACFPCIAKPRHGRGSRAVRVIAGERELDAYLLLEGLDAENVILQELGYGTEYTVQMIADPHGDLRTVVPVEVSTKRGITLHAKTVENPVVDASCRAIHAAYPTAGCYNVQLILTDKGQILPFEINPRISTTFCLSIAAGVDPIAITLGLAHDTGGPAGFLPGVSLRRHWRNSLWNTERL